LPFAAEPARPEEHREEETVETIVLPAQKRQEKPTAGPSFLEDDLEKTVLLSRPQIEGTPERAAAMQEALDDDMEKTVVLGNRGAPGAPPVKEAPGKKQNKAFEDDMEATVIISLSDRDKLQGKK
jgi:hypothetical protein